MSGSKKSPIAPKIRVLNDGEIKTKTKETALELSRRLQKLMLRMKGEVITEDGSGVRYDRIKESSLFAQYKELARSLQSIDLLPLSEPEKKAFFINVYNALTIDGVASLDQLPTSVIKVQLFWKSTAYRLGGHVLTLDDIEHGVLRGNRPHPGSRAKPFADGDPRLPLVLKKLDPRIHFALVCGAKSCPAISVYSAENLESALDAATRSFCSQEVMLYRAQKHILVSKIFQWYCTDFGKNDLEAVRWTLPYLEAGQRETLLQLLQLLETRGGAVNLDYRDYNWSLNAVVDHISPPPSPPPP